MDLSERIQKLVEKRAALVAECRAIMETAEKRDPDKRSLTDDEQKTWDTKADLAEAHGEDIKQLQRQVEMEAKQDKVVVTKPETRTLGRIGTAAAAAVVATAGAAAAMPDDASGTMTRSQAETVVLEARAFESYMRFGMADMGAENRDILNERFRTQLNPRTEQLVRALGADGTGAEGAFTVPEGFVARLNEAQKAFGGMRESGAEIMQTATGNPLPMPNQDDTGNEGAIVAESTSHEQSPAASEDQDFGQKILGAYLYSSKVHKVSIELLQDSAFNLDAHMGKVLGRRIARILNRHFTVGTGTAQPEGIVTGAPVGKTAALNTAITFDELLDLKYSVDPEYRKGAIWMFNDAILGAVRKLKDAEGRYLWDAGSTRTGEPNAVDADPYIINQHMAGFGTTNIAALYGDFSYYTIRDVAGFSLVRLAERYAEFGQVGFVMLSRHDGLFNDPDNSGGAQSPVKKLTLPV